MEIKFSFSNIDFDKIESYNKDFLNSVAEFIKKEVAGKDYSGELSFARTPFDEKIIDEVLTLAKKKKGKFDALFLIGMGGASLGATAVFEGILGNYNNKIKKPEFYCVDNLDDKMLKELLKIAENTLIAGKNILLVIASKSGSTIETLANGALFIDTLEKYRKNWQEFVVVVTDKDTDLERFAQNNYLDFLNVPQKVGGRFSVFTPMGLLPLALLGIDIKSFCIGASIEFIDKAIENALIIHEFIKKDFKVYDNFIFSNRLKSLGMWYRQLFAESLGKKEDLGGQPFEIDMLPTISIGTTDLHSMIQFYLSSKDDRLTNFIFEESGDANVKFDSWMFFENKFTIKQFQKGIFDGVLAAYDNQNRPYIYMKFQEVNLKTVGSFMYLKMLEIVFVAALLNINPFSQPEVDLYKKEVQRILGL